MAIMRCDFLSDVLGLSTSMTVILPQAPADQPPPVLYLHHGLSDDDTMWSRRTSIEQYATERGLAVVMPQVHRSFTRTRTRDCRSGPSSPMSCRARCTASSGSRRDARTRSSRASR